MPIEIQVKSSQRLNSPKEIQIRRQNLNSPKEVEIQRQNLNSTKEIEIQRQNLNSPLEIQILCTLAVLHRFQTYWPKIVIKICVVDGGTTLPKTRWLRQRLCTLDRDLILFVKPKTSTTSIFLTSQSQSHQSKKQCKNSQMTTDQQKMKKKLLKKVKKSKTLKLLMTRQQYIKKNHFKRKNTFFL